MKHRRRGVKREHSVLQGQAAALERLAAMPGVRAVIPGRIAANPTRFVGLVFKVETPTGCKLFAKTTTAIQEVFVVLAPESRQAVLAALRQQFDGHGGSARAPGPTPRRHGRARRAAGWRNPGVLPSATWQRDPVRFTADGRGSGGWGAAGARIGQAGADPATRLRLLILRLRRVRWLRRFGAPPRRVPRPPRPRGAS